MSTPFEAGSFSVVAMRLLGRPYKSVWPTRTGVWVSRLEDPHELSSTIDAYGHGFLRARDVHDCEDTCRRTAAEGKYRTVNTRGKRRGSCTVQRVG